MIYAMELNVNLIGMSCVEGALSTVRQGPDVDRGQSFTHALQMACVLFTLQDGDDL